jgi:site-specific recombinase XerD
MNEIIDAYAQQLRERGVRENTVTLWMRNLSLFERENGPFEQVSPELVVSFLDSRQGASGGISPRTRAAWLTTLRVFYAWAVEAGRFSSSPVASLSTPRFDQTPSTLQISDEDIERAVAKTEHETRTRRELRWMITLAAFEGLTPQEIAYLSS